MARLASHYSTFLQQVCMLIGVPTSRLSTEIAASLNSSFNMSMQKVWAQTTWPEVCPYGETRFLGNGLTYPNDLSQTAYWTATGVTITTQAVSNPADGAVTGNEMMETAANSAHKVVQNFTGFFPNTQYTVSFYGRPNGRNYQYLSIFDGSTTFSAFFNTNTGTIGTTSNFSTATIAQQPNGFWLCQATFTASVGATTAGTYSLQLSSDGSTLSYAGDTSKGAYIWGALCQQTSNVPVQDLVLPWAQTGENQIDAIFNMWPVSPFANNYPPQFGYNETPDGIQIINGTPYQYSYYMNGVAQNNLYGAPPTNPVYIYYRQTCPLWTGNEFDSTATYSVNQQVYFTSTTGYADYYKCIVATTAGQSPDTTPTSWSVITVWDTFVNYCSYQAYGDWLISDGQNDRAMGAYQVADDRMSLQLDKIERQMQAMSPMVVATHLSSRSTW